MVEFVMVVMGGEVVVQSLSRSKEGGTRQLPAD